MQLTPRWFGRLATVFLAVPVSAQTLTVEGPITVVWVDRVDRIDVPPIVTIHAGPGQSYRLEGAGRGRALPQARAGERWRVTGELQGGPRPEGKSLRILTASRRGGAALVQRPTQVRNLTILCAASAGGQAWTYTPASAAAKYGQGYPGVGHFLTEMSEGQLEFVSLPGIGPSTLAGDPSYYGAPDININLLADDCVRGLPNLDLASVDGINFFFNFNSGAAWGGTAFITTQGVGRVISASWIPQNFSNFGVLTHEVGHMLGWSHSGMGYGGEADFPYSSYYDVMSVAESGNQVPTEFGVQEVPTATIAANRAASGWIPTQRLTRLDPLESAEFTLEVIGSGLEGARSAGSRDLVEILTPLGQRYSLEARLRRGRYDDGIPLSGVLLHRITRPIALGLSCCLAKLLDGDDIQDFFDEGVVWLPGESFRDDEAGFGFTVIAALTNGYQVRAHSGWELLVSVQGSGSVSGLPDGDCSSTCTLLSTVGASPLTLTAASASPQMPFRGWLGDCGGAGACQVTRTRDQSVVAWFGQEVAFITASTRPFATQGTPYRDTLAVDAIGQPLWSLTTGALPPGLALSAATGLVAGTPSVTGHFTFTAQVTDGTSSSSRDFSLRVFAPLNLAASDTIGMIQSDHQEVPLVHGNGVPVGVALVAGQWPDGMQPDAWGLLSGVPKVVGPGSVTYEAQREGITSRQTIRYRVLSAPPTILNSDLGFYFVGNPTTRRLTAAGDDQASWSIVAGALPAGLTLVPSNPTTPYNAGNAATIAGRAEVAGNFTFTVETRIAGFTARRAFTIEVIEPRLERQAVLNTLLGANTLLAAQRQYLDFIGNLNGTVDLGDVQAWLRRNGAIPGGSP